MTRKNEAVQKLCQIGVQLPIRVYYVVVLVKDILDLCCHCFCKSHALYTLHLKMHFFGLNIHLNRSICG